MELRTKSILQALFVVFLWATSWVFIKIGLGEIPPLTFAGLRYALAFVCLLGVSFYRGAQKAVRQLTRREWGQLVLLGVLFYAGTQGASFVALAYLPAITVNLLWSFSSVVVALLGVLILRERPAWSQWGGILLACLGALVYFSPALVPEAQLIGLIAAILGVSANAVSAILGRGINRLGAVPPLVVTVISMGVGSILLLGTGLWVEGIPHISWSSWGIILWLAVVNTAFAFTLWNHTLRTLTAMESSIINGTMILWIPILAVVFLGERISPQGIVGLVLVGLGTLIVQLKM